MGGEQLGPEFQYEYVRTPVAELVSEDPAAEAGAHDDDVIDVAFVVLGLDEGPLHPAGFRAHRPLGSEGDLDVGVTVRCAGRRRHDEVGSCHPGGAVQYELELQLVLVVALVESEDPLPVREPARKSAFQFFEVRRATTCPGAAAPVSKTTVNTGAPGLNGHYAYRPGNQASRRWPGPPASSRAERFLRPWAPALTVCP